MAHLALKVNNDDQSVFVATEKALFNEEKNLSEQNEMLDNFRETLQAFFRGEKTVEETVLPFSGDYSSALRGIRENMTDVYDEANRNLDNYHPSLAEGSSHQMKSLVLRQVWEGTDRCIFLAEGMPYRQKASPFCPLLFRKVLAEDNDVAEAPVASAEPSTTTTTEANSVQAEDGSASDSEDSSTSESGAASATAATSGDSASPDATSGSAEEDDDAEYSYEYETESDEAEDEESGSAENSGSAEEEDSAEEAATEEEVASSKAATTEAEANAEADADDTEEEGPAVSAEPAPAKPKRSFFSRFKLSKPKFLKRNKK